MRSSTCLDRSSCRIMELGKNRSAANGIDAEIGNGYAVYAVVRFGRWRGKCCMAEVSLE